MGFWSEVFDDLSDIAGDVVDLGKDIAVAGVETVGKVVVPALDGSMNAVESVGSVGADVLDSVANTTSKTLFNGGEFIGEVLGRGMDNVDDMINDIDSASDFIATLVLIPFVPAVSLAEVAFEKVAEKERAKLRRKEKRYEQTCNNLNNEIRNHFTDSNENISKEFIKNKLEELHAVQSELQAELKDVTDSIKKSNSSLNKLKADIVVLSKEESQSDKLKVMTLSLEKITAELAERNNHSKFINQKLEQVNKTIIELKKVGG